MRNHQRARFNTGPGLKQKGLCTMEYGIAQQKVYHEKGAGMDRQS